MVAFGMSGDAAILPEDPTLLKAMIAALQADNARMSATIRAHDQLIQVLRLRIAKLKKQAFGKSSEKVEREIEQLELALEDLLIAAAEGDATPSAEDKAAPATPTGETAERKPRRRPRVSESTPRERRELDPGTCCPDCGGDLRPVGEDVSEILDMVVAQLKVLEIARLKKSCRRCEKMVQEPAPSRPIPGSMASAALLAYILVSKFDDHLPLYRLAEIFARMGADIPDSTLVDWCGRAMKVLKPLIDRIDDEVMGSDLLHADDTPIRVLDRSLRDRGLGKGVKKGRIWTYVRDQRPWAGAAPPGAVYRFAPDWKEEHVREHLQRAKGVLQADGYKGYAKLYDPGPDGAVQLREAACWAHLRRDFHDVWTATGSRIAREALDRIGALYDIERSITGQPRDIRHAARQRESRSRVEAFRSWCERQLTLVPGKGDLAKAMRYALRRWESFALFLDDGRVAIDTDDVEQPLSASPSGRFGFARFVPPDFDHPRVGGLCIGDEFHLPVTDLLDPVVPARSGLVAVLFGRPCAQLELAHLHRHEGWPRPAIRFFLREKRPDQRRDLARGGDCRDIRALAVFDAQEERPQRARHTRRGPGRLDQHRPRCRIALLGDASVDRAAVAGLPHARRQAEVAGKLLWRGEATDVADGGDHRSGDHRTDPGHAHQLSHARIVEREADQRRLQRREAAIQPVQLVEVTREEIALGLGQWRLYQPASPAFTEEVTLVLRDQVRMQHRMHAALRPADRSHHRHAFGDEPPQGERIVIRRPDLGQKAGGVELSEDRGVDLVGLHPRMRDGLHLHRVCDHHPRDEGCEQPHNGRCVPRRFQHDLVVRSKALAKGHDRIVLQLKPEALGGNTVLVDRDLRETSMDIHSDRSHALLSQSLSGECAG